MISILPTLAKALLLTSAILLSIPPSANASENSATGSRNKCIMKRFWMYVNHTMVHNGRWLRCEGHVSVIACGGFCESYEYGIYRIPYKKSWHPVCTYAGWKNRMLVIPGCDRDHPNRFAKVFDATGCGCMECNSTTTRCENLRE